MNAIEGLPNLVQSLLMSSSKKQVEAKSHKKRYSKLINSVWIFPAILTLLLIVFTVFKISGSSIGIYQNYFYPGQKDNNLIAGTPQSIRSDEFLNNTQMTIAQSKNHFAQINKNLGYGENMSLVEDSPYKSWSELFKPHNSAFLYSQLITPLLLSGG